MPSAGRILIISAHPDDEVLGCAGAILKHRDAGDPIGWIVSTAAHEPRWSAERIEAKAAEVDAVAAGYGVEHLYRLGLPTVRLDAVPLDDIVSAMRPGFVEFRPDTVYVVNPNDVHTDHGAVFQAAWTLMKNFRAVSHGPRRVLLYETLSSTEAAPPLRGREFVPTVFCDISDYMERKLELAALYVSEMQPEPLPRSPSAIRALARLRGAAVGVQYAEAFQLLREVI